MSRYSAPGQSARATASRAFAAAQPRRSPRVRYQAHFIGFRRRRKLATADGPSRSHLIAVGSRPLSRWLTPAARGHDDARAARPSRSTLLVCPRPHASSSRSIDGACPAGGRANALACGVQAGWLHPSRRGGRMCHESESEAWGVPTVEYRSLGNSAVHRVQPSAWMLDSLCLGHSGTTGSILRKHMRQSRENR